MFNEKESLEHAMKMEKLKSNPSISGFTKQSPVVINGQVINQEDQKRMAGTISKPSTVIEYIKASEVELFKLEKQRKDSGVQPILETLEKYLIFAYGVDNFKTNEEIKTYLGYSSALAIKDYRGNILVTFNSNEEGDQNKTTTDYDTVVYFTYDTRVKTWYKKVFKFDFSSDNDYSRKLGLYITYGVFDTSGNLSYTFEDFNKTFKLTEYYIIPSQDVMIKGKIKTLIPHAKHDKTIIRVIPEEEVSETDSGLLLINRHTETDKMGEKKHSIKYYHGQILSNGPGIFTERDGNFIPNQFEVGDYVFIGMFAGTEVMIDGESFKIAREFDLICSVTTLQLAN